MFTVATWNLENFFAPGSQFGPDSQDVFDRKVALLASTIETAAVDVLAVQEVGDVQAFDALLAALGGAWTGQLSTHFEPSHSIRVGFVSRKPVASVSEYVEIPEKLQGVPTTDAGQPLLEMGRGALRIRITEGGADIDLVSVHLKSKLLSFPGGRFSPHDEGERARYAAYSLLRRAAEAAAVRYFANSLLDGEGTTRRLAVMGDFNDGVEAARRPRS